MCLDLAWFAKRFTLCCRFGWCLECLTPRVWFTSVYFFTIHYSLNAMAYVEGWGRNTHTHTHTQSSTRNVIIFNFGVINNLLLPTNVCCWQTFPYTSCFLWKSMCYLLGGSWGGGQAIEAPKVQIGTFELLIF